MSPPTARVLNQAAKFYPVGDPDTLPMMDVAGVTITAYVEDDGGGALRLVVSVDFEDVRDQRLIDENDTIRTTVTFNGEPQDTYDRSTGTRTTN